MSNVTSYYYEVVRIVDFAFDEDVGWDSWSDEDRSYAAYNVWINYRSFHANMKKENDEWILEKLELKLKEHQRLYTEIVRQNFSQYKFNQNI